MSSADRRVVDASPDMVRHVVRNIRPIDRVESLAFYGKEPEEMIAETLENSRLAWVGLLDGEPVVAFGCACYDTLESTGVPWLFGTPKLERCAKTFVRMSKPYLAAIINCHLRLTNCVDVRNELAIKWLRWLGFTVEPAAPAGYFGLPFHRIWMEAKC